MKWFFLGMSIACGVTTYHLFKAGTGMPGPMLSVTDGADTMDSVVRYLSDHRKNKSG